MTTTDLDRCGEYYVNHVFTSYAISSERNKQNKPSTYTYNQVGFADYKKDTGLYIYNIKKNGISKSEWREKDKNGKYKESAIAKNTREKMHNKKTGKNKVSTLFESIFQDKPVKGKYVTGLNTDVVKEGSILRVWSALDKQSGAEKHTVVTIDNPANNRRVSFDTTYNTDYKVFLGDKNLGDIHEIASPEPSFIKLITLAYQKRNLSGILKLKAIGSLGKEDIRRLKQYLIDETVPTPTERNSWFITTNDGKNGYFIHPVYRTSKTLVYNRINNTIYRANNNKFKFQNVSRESTELTTNSLRYINCASFQELLFGRHIFRSKTVTKVMLNKFGFRPTTPNMLRPTNIYTCDEDGRLTCDKLNTEKGAFPTVLSLSTAYHITGMHKYAKYRLPVFIITIIVGLIWNFGINFTRIHTIIPLEMFTSFDWRGISTSQIIQLVSEKSKELISSGLCLLGRISYGFEETCKKSKKDLDSEYGKENIDIFLNLLEKVVTVKNKNTYGPDRTRSRLKHRKPSPLN